jgi:hypothetical protein
MYEEYTSTPDRFIDNGLKIENQSDFENAYSVELRDFNSAGVVAANQGIPLSSMDRHSYEVYGETIQVSSEQRELCRTTIKNLVDKL